MADFSIRQGDRLPILTDTIVDAAGTAVDLTSAVGVDLRTRAVGSDTVVTAAGTITAPTTGSVSYSWGAGDTDTAGVRNAEWRVDFGGGIYLTSDPFTVEVLETVATVETNELVLSIAELKSYYLFGADLTNDAGEPFPDAMFEHYIKAAVAWLEKELDIFLEARDIVAETYDHYSGDYGHWGWFQLDHYPIISVSKVEFQYPSMLSGVEINSDWHILSEEGASGQFQIVPGQGNIADVLIIPGALMPMWSGATGRVPSIWRFDYRAGFEVGQLPGDLKHAIGMHAAIGIFNIAGDLIAGAGIASLSISVPGLNQNVNTTSSATNSGYGARIIEYQKELKEMLPNLKRFYGKNTRMVVA